MVKKKIRKFNGRPFQKSIIKSNKHTMYMQKQKLNTMGISYRVVKEGSGYRFYVGGLKKTKKVQKSW